MATITYCYKLKVGFKVNPTEEKEFYFSSTLDKNDTMCNITSAFELGRIYLAGCDITINMADVSWFNLSWESCCK